MTTTTGHTPYDEEYHARRATSFGAQAAAYDEYRPTYPDDAVRWALDPVGVHPRTRVLDLAAGTGKLTGVLAGLGVDVVAVEPDPDMLAQLRRGLPDVEALSGRAEAIPLPDASLDAVVAGQAFHWFDTDVALPEIARVLRPGGVVAALWNFDDPRVDWIAGLRAVSRSRLGSPAQRSQTAFGPHPDYEEFVQAEFTRTEPRTIDAMIATIRTHSHILLLNDDERADVLSRTRDYLRSRPETSTGTFDLPLVTLVVRGIRR